MKRIDEINLNNKTVLIRVDFNVPLDEHLQIIDDYRIKESLKTIQYCLANNCKIILLSHLGKVKTKEDKIKKSLKNVAKHLSELLNQEIIFLKETKGKQVEKQISTMNHRDILLLENTRFEDLDGNKESSCDQELAKYWASLADVFINDAFGVIHRNHASNAGILKYSKESCLGFLMIKEMENLNLIKNNPQKPFVVLLGGSKIHDKIQIIKTLIEKADYVLIGGGMAYTFLKAQGIEIGKSLVDEESLSFAKEILKKTDKIILPIDHVVSKSLELNSTDIKENMVNDDIALDIGPKTISLFEQFLKKSRTIFWNGPMGYYEIKKYQKGTKQLCEFIGNLKAISIVGGGDTASCIIKMGYQDKFSHVSTGGGASLKFIEGTNLPGINI